VIVEKGKIRAIALEYNAEEMDAPIVSALGANELASLIVKQAYKCSVPVVTSDQIIKKFNQIEINETIPEDLYTEVANIFVKYSIK